MMTITFYEPHPYTLRSLAYRTERVRAHNVHKVRVHNTLPALLLAV